MSVPPYPVMFIESNNDSPGCMIYYSRKLQKFIFLAKKDCKDATHENSSIPDIIKVLSWSYDPINIDYRYPTTWSDSKKNKLNKLLGSTDSKKKMKSRLNGLLGLLMT